MVQKHKLAKSIGKHKENHTSWFPDVMLPALRLPLVLNWDGSVGFGVRGGGFSASSQQLNSGLCGPCAGGCAGVVLGASAESPFRTCLLSLFLRQVLIS